MNKTYVFEMFIGLLVINTTIFSTIFNALIVGLVLNLMLFLPPFSYQLRSLDERELILTNKTGQITRYLLLVILVILYKLPHFELGVHTLAEIWFPIAFGMEIFMNGAVSLYLFNKDTFDS